MMNSPLLTPAELATLQLTVHERATRQQVATTFAAGQHRSRYRGQGVELDDSRPYHPGDNIRHMDWRATARSGRATMKVFREEKQRSLYLLIDRTPSMAFGTRVRLKIQSAAICALQLAFTALAHHESVAAAIVDTTIDHYAPTRTLDASFALINAINAPVSTTPSTRMWSHANIMPLLQTIEQRSLPGCSVVVISDFIGLTAQQARLLAHLNDKRPLTALQISDPAEHELPAAGWLRLRSPITGESAWVDSHNPGVREQFRAHAAQRQQQLVQQFAQMNVALQSISTTVDLCTPLEALR